MSESQCVDLSHAISMEIKLFIPNSSRNLD